MMLDNSFSSKKNNSEHLLCANSCAKCIPKVIVFNVLKLLSEHGTIIPILKMKKLRLREANFHL